MMDFTFLLLLAAFFAASIALVFAFDKLGGARQ